MTNNKEEIIENLWKGIIKQVKVKLVILVESDPKAPFSIATTPRCRGGRYSISWIAPPYPLSLPHSAKC